MSELMEKPEYLRLEEQDLHDWAFNRPVEWEFLDRKLDQAESIEREGDTETAIQTCLEIINSCPEYLPAINKLGLLYKQEGRLDAASDMFESAVAIGVACVPEKFEIGTDLIPWHWEDNRAFLLACESYRCLGPPGFLHLFESRLPRVNKLSLESSSSKGTYTWERSPTLLQPHPVVLDTMPL